jgi:hypothetical protein
VILRKVSTLKATRQALYVKRDIAVLCEIFVSVEKQWVCFSLFYPA